MKKIIFSLILAIVLTLCTVCASAEAQTVYFSDDYGKMYIGDEVFSLRNNSFITNYMETEIEVTLSDEQKLTISEIAVWADENFLTASADIYYKNGAYLYLPYINDKIIEQYDSILDSATEYTINFIWPDDNIVTADKSLFYGEKRIMDLDGEMYYMYDVSVSDNEVGLTILMGSVMDIDGAFYFAEYKENNIGEAYGFEYDFTPDAVLYRITDKTLVEDLQNGQKKYLGESIVTIPDDGFFKSFSVGFIIALFCVIPAALLLICLFAAIRSRGIYKKLYFAVCFFCAAELSVFITVMILIARYS